ncbi:MAG: SGNH/GDSL hydrolase family protein [Streptosporangiales bacterium]|nr:SGNH/GDSL hydrolase family protein [Streptosporangiales bacterium]
MRFLFLPPAVAVAAALGATPAAADDGARLPAVGAWAASPQAPSEGFTPNWSEEGFADHTLRQVVRPAASGSRVRIRLSNRYGSAPLRIAGATIGKAGDGAAVRPGTLRRLTFGSAPSAYVPAGEEGAGERAPAVTVPVGEEVESDFAPLRVTAFQPLTVTLHLREPTGPATFHAASIATSYRATGDHLTDRSGAPFTESTTSWYYLTGIEVAGPKPRRDPVVVLGDSITDGTGSTLDANNRFPDELAERLAAEREARPVLNAGIAGNRVLNDSSWFGESALDRFDHDVLALLDDDGIRGHDGDADGTVLVLEGINDIGFSEWEHPGAEPNPEASAEQLIAGHRELTRRAHAAGLRVVGATLLPYEGAFYFTERGEAVRDEVNHWIRTSGAYDAVVDLDRALAAPDDPDRLHPDFDSGDHLHPGDAGYRAMAEAVDPEVLD